jgi:phosphoserine phosphatase
MAIPRHEMVATDYKFVRLDETKLFSFCKPLLLRLQLAKIGVIVISGAPVEPLLAYSERLPLTKVFGVKIAVSENDVYTTTIEHIYGLLKSKIQAVKNIVKDGSTVVLAIGNSFNDCPLLSVAKQRFFVLEGDQPEPIKFVHPEDLLNIECTEMI